MSPAAARAATACLLTAWVYGAAGCGEVDPCIEASVECTPLYEPTFDEIFTRTLAPSCGVEGSSCHSADGARAGLIFEDPDQAYDLLLGQSGSEPRVIPGDADCSVLSVRVSSSNLGRQMPPGEPLSSGEQCAIIQWIANGAQR